MPSIEVSLLVLAALVIVPCFLTFILQVARIKSLKGKILDHEYEMVKTHAYVLELEKENVKLKKEVKPQHTAGVIAIGDKSSKTATG
jgi:predicted Holliday junction resolvase-like endonuclease